ncbi:uncharacterized protein LOC143218505 [Lasioglossum baleicum]|uniref:uncharacterized protein LOC143218505 n=1 Tax=Lasioglossum baleicum TaxID=434251 RepID=UPI003FCE596F
MIKTQKIYDAKQGPLHDFEGKESIDRQTILLTKIDTFRLSKSRRSFLSYFQQPGEDTSIRFEDGIASRGRQNSIIEIKTQLRVVLSTSRRGREHSMQRRYC